MVAERILEEHLDMEDISESMKTRAGRPRSDHARKSILDAARKLLVRTSLSVLTIEAIAKKAGVGKTTIYRWWPNKASVAMEAFLEQPGIQNIMPTTTTASEGVQRQLESLIRQLRGQNGRIIAGIIAESQADPAVLDLLYEKFLKERVENLYDKIEMGKENGEFRTSIQTDIALDMMMGPLFLRILSGEHGIDNDFADAYPRQAVFALQA